MAVSDPTASDMGTSLTTSLFLKHRATLRSSLQTLMTQDCRTFVIYSYLKSSPATNEVHTSHYLIPTVYHRGD